MNALELITKKRNRENLSAQEIEWLVRSYTKNEVPDYQMAAFLMAVYFAGMSLKETTALTLSMASSGTVLDLSSVPGVKVDKHSTGGVGDTTTLILAPLLASASVPVAKMSGRALGITGGTIDKLEAIPNFRTQLTQTEFLAALKRNNLALTAQTGYIAPADGKIYALRDVTATVESIPLIASSVMSKKIAAGADKILLDVKVGSGAFFKEKDKARELAETMVSIGRLAGRQTAAFITNMDAPLGQAVGNSLEVAEAIKVLAGGCDLGKELPSLLEVTLNLGAKMLLLAGKTISLAEAKERLAGLIASGQALAKFKDFIETQGGDSRVIDNPALLPQALFKETVTSEKSGYLEKFDAGVIGALAIKLGAGRQYKGQEIDLTAGVLIHVQIGEWVERGQALFSLLSSSKNKMQAAQEWVESAARQTVVVRDAPVEKPVLIYEVIE
ncbi:MAG: thymidine phosphorylase [Sporomusaceae bacterium]|jgi:pyrimidine-nucleoside phosphorylase|nr:thymidine phosphorylase [Sporomusaceae bacterium]